MSFGRDSIGRVASITNGLGNLSRVTWLCRIASTNIGTGESAYPRLTRTFRPT